MNAYMAYKVTTQVKSSPLQPCRVARPRQEASVGTSECPRRVGFSTACCAFQTTLQMFRNKTFTVRRRFSDFLGLYEKLSEKHGPNGFIVPPPPEKSILGASFRQRLPVGTVTSGASAEGWAVVLSRNDQGEGGEGGLLLCRLC